MASLQRRASTEVYKVLRSPAGQLFLVPLKLCPALCPATQGRVLAASVAHVLSTVAAVAILSSISQDSIEVKSTS